MGRLDGGREGSKDNAADFQFRHNIDWAQHDRKQLLQQYISSAEAQQIGVAYILYTEVFSSDSKTRHFNRTVDRIRADPRALDLLGSGQTIRAFGEPTASKWSRNRPLA